ncbi:MAG TPA: hypothetical protein P5087_00525 [Eubacteriales bacterium]|nr:hypothetical protein [Clostridia bacterium]HRX13495.1 hypothetical protein [Eubacteriales bacterium]
MAKLFKDEKPIPMDTYNTAVSLRDIVSEEGDLTDGVFEPTLKNVTLEVKKGETVGLYSKNPLESKLTVEIIANLRNYYSGKCVLIERGMIRNKRYILPQLFFFNQNSMLIENMTVLEYATFTQNLKSKEYAKMQKTLLDEICALGMDYISLTPIHNLTNQEKILVQLYIAYLTKSNIVVAELNEIVFTEKEINIFQAIVKSMIKEQMAFIFATGQATLIGKVATKYIRIDKGFSQKALPVKEITLKEKLFAIKKELVELLKNNEASAKTSDEQTKAPNGTENKNDL